MSSATNARIRRATAAARQRLDAIQRAISTPDSSGRTALDRIHPACDTVRATATDSGTIHGGAIPDPTGDAAAHSSDARRSDHAVLVDQLEVIIDAAGEVLSVLEAHPPPQTPHRLPHTAEAPECRSCRRVGVHSRSHRLTDCAGALHEPTPLCLWCLRWSGRLGRLVPRRVVRWHHEHPHARLLERERPDGTVELVGRGEVLATVQPQPRSATRGGSAR